jgi:hypothetical protein
VAQVLGRIAGTARLHPAHVNGHPALIIRLGRAIDTVLAVRVDDGRITGLYAVRNPEKLSHMESETALRRWALPSASDEAGEGDGPNLSRPMVALDAGGELMP